MPGDTNGWHEWRDEVNRKVEILIDSHIRTEGAIIRLGGAITRLEEAVAQNTGNIDRLARL